MSTSANAPLRGAPEDRAAQGMLARQPAPQLFRMNPRAVLL